MLKIEQLCYSHQQTPLLNHIHLHLQKGELLTLLGANGAGKSTLLNCISGVLPLQGGQIFIENRPLATLSTKEIAQKIAYVSQSAPQTYQYSVRDYVALGRTAYLGMFEKPNEADFALVEQALATLNIQHLADKTYMLASGGEKQLINIAKVLVQQPQIILFDEPTSALDYGNTLKTLSLIRTLAEQQFTIIMTTHNPDHPLLLHQSLPHSKTAILDQQGHLMVGNTAEMITEHHLKQLYQMDLRLVQVSELDRHLCAIQHL